MQSQFATVIAGIGEDRFRKPIMPRDVEAAIVRIGDYLENMTVLVGDGRHTDNGHVIKESVRMFMFKVKDDTEAEKVARMIRDEFRQIQVTLILQGVGTQI